MQVLLNSFCFIIILALSIPLSVSASMYYSPFEIDKLIGEKAPDFNLINKNGTSVSLSSFKGKVVLLNFWANWCPTCKRELKSLNSLNKLYRDRDLVVLSIVVDNNSEVFETINNKQVDFDVLVDHDQSVSLSLYKIFMFPTTFIIDKNGIIVKRYFGQQIWTQTRILNELDKLLEG